MRQNDVHTIHRDITKQCALQGDFWKSPLAKCSSNDVISKTFLAVFLKDEYMFIQQEGAYFSCCYK